MVEIVESMVLVSPLAATAPANPGGETRPMVALSPFVLALVVASLRFALLPTPAPVLLGGLAQDALSLCVTMTVTWITECATSIASVSAMKAGLVQSVAHPVTTVRRSLMMEVLAESRSLV